MHWKSALTLKYATGGAKPGNHRNLEQNTQRALHIINAILEEVCQWNKANAGKWVWRLVQVYDSIYIIQSRMYIHEHAILQWPRRAKQ